MTQLADMPLGNSKNKMSAMALLFCLETHFIGNHLDPKTFIGGAHYLKPSISCLCVITLFLDETNSPSYINDFQNI